MKNLLKSRLANYLFYAILHFSIMKIMDFQTAMIIAVSHIVGELVYQEQQKGK
jgi:hypothetical protein